MIIVKVPLENSNDTLGCRKAGNEILKNFPKEYTSENKRLIEKNSLRLEEIHLDNSKLKEAGKLIYKNSVELIETNEKTIFLGGDGSMCYEIGRAFKEVCKNEDKIPMLVIFDAHADVHKSKNLPNNQEWLRKLIEDGFPGENIILIGFRSGSSLDNEFLINHKIKVYEMKGLNDYEEICDIVMELARQGEIYISIDIDVIDSVFVPGTARGESAGMTTRQLIYFLQRFNLIKSLRVIDINEINPELDVNGQTVKLGTKILGEVLGN